MAGLGGVKVAGTKGKVTLAPGALQMIATVGDTAAVAHVMRYNYTITADEHPADTYDDTANVKKVEGGMIQVRGSIEGFLDKTMVFDLGTADTGFKKAYNVGGDIELFHDVTVAAGMQTALKCTVMISPLNVQSERGGSATFSGNFVNTGTKIYHKGRMPG